MWNGRRNSSPTAQNKASYCELFGSEMGKAAKLPILPFWFVFDCVLSASQMQNHSAPGERPAAGTVLALVTLINSLGMECSA